MNSVSEDVLCIKQVFVLEWCCDGSIYSYCFQK